jgi:general secretion pathway protein L
MSSATQSLRPQLDRVRRAWRASPLPSFLAWWGGELRALLPPRWRRAFGGGADWFVLEQRGGEWCLGRANREETLARWDSHGDAATQQAALKQALHGIDRDDLRLALGLPAAAGLRRIVALPLAARDNLQQVMAFEVDRQTPFRAEQVYYAAREVKQAAAEGRIAAELIAIPRPAVDPLLAQLGTLGVRVDAVDLLLDGRRAGVNLLPPAQRTHRRHPRLRLNLALAAASLLLLALVLGQWLHNRQAALDTMQSQVDAMRGEAQQVAALRQQLQDNAGAAGFLARRKQQTVSMLALLQELTRRLPGDAWLERFSVDNSGQLGFQGQARQATRLVDALKDSPLIRDAGFQGSIQPDPASGKERFYMVAQVRRPAAAKAAAATSDSESTP